MSDLIKMTEREHEWLNNFLPDDMRTVELYRQPALAEFCIETLHDSNVLTKYTFSRGSDALEQAPEVKKVAAEKLDASTIVVCTLKSFSPSRKIANADYIVFGYSSQSVFVFTPKTYFWNYVDRQGTLMEVTNEIVRLYESIQYLLLHHKELLQFSVTKEPSKHSGKKKGGKTKKSPSKKIRLYRLVHMTDEQTEDLKKTIRTECEKRKFERSCTAWGVRGHYRHYKSGKVAYIKPHVRGKEKEKYTGREYALFPKNIPTD